jgi:hypothetical protein
MTQEEAATLLANCKGFIVRLAAGEVIGDLKNDQEREALKGFNRVWTADLVDNSEVQRLAGFSQQDITSLKYFLFKRETSQMWLEYYTANTKTCFACRYLLWQMDKQGPSYKLTEVNKTTLRKFGKLMENLG